jgi:hypothetical protein
MPLTHLAGFLLVIVGVPAADAILHCWCCLCCVTLLLLVSYRIVDGIPTVVGVLTVALALLF